ncbi:hypothetical protein E1B28_011153 [Marasmius oreades]|uniref:Skg3/CAF120-like PH-like domain-containing protein n=1 Tax=Marasmius oreades TaxID=181124 RepID=A0A9P7RU47_9AGAR|nr:uncharacterized protein E1B28_011153 [Marasmius oreades]KAG7089468.1 hypothetical protein E1B28_011153 [Marasmius oreades]
MVIHEASDNQPDELGRVPSNNGPAAHPTANTAAGRMKRMSNLFSPKDHGATGTAFQKPTVVVYASPKPKDRKKPILTVNDITQAFAVYPERPELITRSTLIKLEGSLGAEELAGGMRGRQGWLLLMPQSEGNLSPAAEMLKWVIALHDAFKLYGRPQAWTWDPRAPNSLMFAYPVGPHKDLLFLAREQAEKFDPREERTSVIRSRYIDLLNETMQQSDPARPPQQPQQRAPVANPPSRGYQLPPLSFDRTDQQQDRHLLTPITERSSIYTHGISISGDAATLATKPSMKTTNGDPSGVTEVIPEEPRTPPVASNGDNPLDNVIIGPNGRPSIDEGASPPPPPNKDGFDRTAPARSTTGSQYNEPTNMSLAVEKSTGRSSLDVPGNANNVNVIRSGSPLGSPVRKPASILSNGTADQKPQSPGSPSVSSIPLRSPHSPSLGGGGPLLERSATPSGSVLTSPYSPTPSMKQGSPSPTKSTFSFAPSASFATVSRNSSASASMGGTAMPISAGAAAVPAGTKGVGGLSNEAGALHYMQHGGGGGGGSGGRMPATIAETDMDGDDGDDSSAEFSGPPGQTQDSARPVVTAINTAGRPSYADSVSPVVRQGTPMAFVERAGGGMNDRPNPSGSAESPPIVNAASANSSPSRPGVLGRKPSGARAQANNSRMNITGNVESVTSSSATHPQPQRRPPQAIQEEMDEDTHTTTSAPLNVSSPKKDLSRSMTVTTDDSSLDVLAALSYLDVTDPSQDQFGVEKLEEPVAVKPVQPLRTNRTSSASPPPAQLPGPVKSSFAPSNKAAERKAKVQAQQAAAAAAASRPGRAANGKRKMRSAKAYAGAWSSDEEEDEEDEDEEEGNEEVDSDGEPTSKPASGMNSSNTSVKPPLEGGDPYDSFHQQQGPAHLRPARNLPQIPAGRSQDEPLPPRRSQLEPQYTQHAQMSPQQYPQIPRSNYFEDNTPIRTQEHPQPGAARQQNIWSHVLDPGHTPGEASPSNTRDTFVQIEPPSQTMTKAFTPQGLLSAGIQDKQGRSAKRQEELARESGASLINVPNKPPPPQTGLLGAITAHERERKRDGGVGAALTERERERRLAEERQRRFDDAQRQQLDQMQQGGSMYGNQFGMNPMMMGMGMNPMSMMGMNPMMTGGMNPMMTGGGMNPMMSQYGMMGGLNPQHMYAAQQAAAQAYQQAMMAFSTAGSQPGGDGPNGNMNGGSPSLNPMMAGGNMMGGMGGMGVGFDPRMSMMMVNPMSMQMTGMSQFDPRFPPQNTGGTPSPMNELPSSLLPLGGLGGNPAPGSSSPARHGSPLARPNDTPDSGARGSRPTSPKPQ